MAEQRRSQLHLGGMKMGMSPDERPIMIQILSFKLRETFCSVRRSLDETDPDVAMGVSMASIEALCLELEIERLDNKRDESRRRMTRRLH